MYKFPPFEQGNNFFVFLGKDKYIVDKQLGKGTYGTVYKAIDLRKNKTVALKLQKPPNRWEFYICREIQSRLSNHPLRDRFMDVPIGYFSKSLELMHIVVFFYNF